MRKKRLLTVAAALLGTFLAATSASAAGYAENLSEDEIAALEETTVIKDESSPTGYYVTFRYKDAEASRVRIYGEWKFSDVMHATFVTSENATPEEWEDGDIVWKTDGWPTADMEKDEETGVWSYTIPLPNGTWAYRFYVGGAEGAELTDYTDAKMVPDPANVNYLAPDEDLENLGGEQCLTTVYVPYDEVKQANTIRRDEEAPRDGENGTVEYVVTTLESGASSGYEVYLPYGYDAEREEKYPVFVLFHGGGGYDGSWMTNGLVNILDNMIAEGRLEPTIVVTPCGEDFHDDVYHWKRDDIMTFLNDNLLPYVAENYNAADDPARRALGGLSQGGATVAYCMFNNTDAFDTYIHLSAPYMGDTELDFTIPELKEKTIFFGYGDYDFVQTRSLYKMYPDEEGNMVKLAPQNEGSIWEYMYGLAGEGVEFSSMNYPYGHDWVLWRKLLVTVFDEILWK